MNETLCWRCAWACGRDGRCSWSCDGVPVTGWDAVRRDTPHKDRTGESYIVVDCPEFVADCTDSRDASSRVDWRAA